jgi:hypothetical protein
MRSRRSCARGPRPVGMRPWLRSRRLTLSSLTWPTPPPRRPVGCWPTRNGRCGKPEPLRRNGSSTAGRTRSRVGVGVAWPVPSTILWSCGRRPDGSRPRLGSGWPGSPRTGRPGGPACTTPTPGRSRRASSANRSSSATKPKLLTTTTVSFQLDQRIHGLDQQIAATFRRRHQAKTIESMPGFGPILGAQLLVAAGDLRGYPSAGHLAAAAGLVPVPNDSGRRSGNLHKPRRYSRPLRHVLSVRADQHDASGSQPCLLPQETR